VAANREHVIFPDGCADLIFSSRCGVRAVGVMNRPARQALSAGDRYVGVRFQPGAGRASIGVPGSLLVDQSCSLDDLWGVRGRQLCERMSGARSPREQLHLLAAALPAPSSVPRLWSALRVDSIDAAAARVGCSSRQLRRRCMEETGLSPKRLARILRFRHALLLARQPDPDWADIAIRCGYFDQAHLIRDFHEFAGGPPTSVFSNRSSPVRR
jgi:AraC-like DNA-binding protein